MGKAGRSHGMHWGVRAILVLVDNRRSHHTIRQHVRYDRACVWKLRVSTHAKRGDDTFSQ